MPVAYTPGLRVTADTLLHATRRLPMRGQVLVAQGDVVTADTVVARAEIPGILHLDRMAQRLHVEPSELAAAMVKQVGDEVKAGDVMARTPGLFGRYFKSEAQAMVSGTIEEISTTSGYVRIREAPRRIDVLAHFAGTIVEVRMEGDDDTISYLVGSIEERNDEFEVLSTSSPLGQALLEHRPGETVSYEGPRRTFAVEIVSVRPVG
jgi:transcription elongation GreA/GreB family factor